MIRLFRNTLFIVFILLLFPMPLIECQSRQGGNRDVRDPMHVTAYTLNEQPTASGEWPRIGFAASNRLPLNTLVYVSIPEKSVERLFVIKDRMNDNYDLYPDNRDGLDLWTDNPAWAKWFGRNRNVRVTIVRLGDG